MGFDRKRIAFAKQIDPAGDVQNIPVYSKQHQLKTDFEYILTNSHKANLVAYVAKHPKQFPRLTRLALADRQPYSQKAAWLLWSCMKEDDNRLKKYTRQIIRELPQKIDSQKRELLIALSKMNLEIKELPMLFDICVDIWRKTDKKPSVRYAAFRVLIKIATQFPGFINEIDWLAGEEFTRPLSMTVRKSLSRLLSQAKCSK